jgi:hypothetical protein
VQRNGRGDEVEKIVDCRVRSSPEGREAAICRANTIWIEVPLMLAKASSIETKRTALSSDMRAAPQMTTDNRLESTRKSVVVSPLHKSKEQ